MKILNSTQVNENANNSLNSNTNNPLNNTDNLAKIYRTYIQIISNINKPLQTIDKIKILLKEKNYDYQNENDFKIEIKNNNQYQLINNFKQINNDIYNLIENILQFQTNTNFFSLMLFRIEVNLNFLNMINQNLIELNKLINDKKLNIGLIDKKINYIYDLNQKFNNSYMKLPAINNNNANWLLKLKNDLNLYSKNIDLSKNNLIKLYKLIKTVIEENKDYQVRYNILHEKLNNNDYQNILITSKEIINTIEINITDIMYVFNKDSYSDETIKYLGNVSGLLNQFNNYDYMKLISKKIDYYLTQFNSHRKTYKDFFIEDTIFGTKKHLGYFVIENIKDILKIIFQTHNTNFENIDIEEYKQSLLEFKKTFTAFLSQIKKIDEFVNQEQLWQNNLLMLKNKKTDNENIKRKVI